MTRWWNKKQPHEDPFIFLFFLIFFSWPTNQLLPSDLGNGCHSTRTWQVTIHQEISFHTKNSIFGCGLYLGFDSWFGILDHSTNDVYLWKIKKNKNKSVKHEFLVIVYYFFGSYWYHKVKMGGRYAWLWLGIYELLIYTLWTNIITLKLKKWYNITKDWGQTI